MRKSAEPSVNKTQGTKHKTEELNKGRKHCIKFYSGTNSQLESWRTQVVNISLYQGETLYRLTQRWEFGKHMYENWAQDGKIHFNEARNQKRTKSTSVFFLCFPSGRGPSFCPAARSLRSATIGCIDARHGLRDFAEILLNVAKMLAKFCSDV